MDNNKPPSSIKTVSKASAPRRQAGRAILADAIVIAACVIGLGIFFGYTNYAKIISADTQTQLPEKPNHFNAFGKIAEKYLSESCAQLTHSWGSQISENTPIGVSVFAPKHDGDSVSLSVEVVVPKQGVSYISADIHDVADDRCSIIYDRTTHWVESCTLVSKHRFADYKLQRLLKERISYLRKANSKEVIDNLYLLPLAQGCLTIEKGLLWTAKNTGNTISD